MSPMDRKFFGTTAKFSKTLREKLFPDFVPDDPEKPHLTSRKKEKERQEIILQIIHNIVEHNGREVNPEKLGNNNHVFNDEAQKSLWFRLAMNLLYACKSKSIVNKVQ